MSRKFHREGKTGHAAVGETVAAMAKECKQLHKVRSITHSIRKGWSFFVGNGILLRLFLGDRTFFVVFPVAFWGKIWYNAFITNLMCCKLTSNNIEMAVTL